MILHVELHANKLRIKEKTEAGKKLIAGGFCSALLAWLLNPIQLKHFRLTRKRVFVPISNENYLIQRNAENRIR